MSIEIQGNTGKLTLGDGSTVWVKRKEYGKDAKSGSPIMGFDFRYSPKCGRCDGHADERGFAEGGYEMVEFQMSGMTYKSTAACPHCVFGAFRNQVQDLGWPADVVAYWDRRERRETDMAGNSEYAVNTEVSERASDRVAALVDGVVGDVGGF